MVRNGVSRRGFLVGSLGLAGGLTMFGGGIAHAGGEPPFIDTAGWGARPNSDIVPVWNQRPVKILVHHTASPNVADTSRAAADDLARSIQNFHMDGRGWLDSGQHFTISRGGFLLEGRHRSLEVLRGGRQQVEGAHCTGQNVVAVGIENEGTYIDADPPPALWDRLRETCAFICTQYGIAPTELYGHRDFKNTACPGDRLYGMLPRLRAEVAAALRVRLSATESVKASWPLLQQGDTGQQVLAAQAMLRAGGFTEAEPDGEFDARTGLAVRRFQLATRAEEVNGLLGGESWPVLVARHGTGEAAAALSSGSNAEALPDEPRARDWQKLLGTSGAPTNYATDPSGPPR